MSAELCMILPRNPQQRSSGNDYKTAETLEAQGFRRFFLICDHSLTTDIFNWSSENKNLKISRWLIGNGQDF